MSNIVKFPRRTRATATQLTLPVKPSAAAPPYSKKKVWVKVMVTIQLLVALVWPVLKWVLAIDVTWQFARMLYLWNTPGTYAGFVFLLHFGVLSALTYFVAVYRPPRWSRALKI